LNIVYDDSGIFFSVGRIDDNTVIVREGCIFYWAGVGTEMATTPTNSGLIMPKRIPISKFEAYGNEYPGDSIGTNYLIEEKRVSVSKSGYIYLSLIFNNEDIDWKLSLTNDIGNIIPDGSYDGYTANYDTGCYMEIITSVTYPILTNVDYSFSEVYDSSKIPIAHITCTTGPDAKITSIQQIFEGVLCLTRETEITSNNPTVEL
jgi:hypothetical protein